MRTWRYSCPGAGRASAPSRAASGIGLPRAAEVIIIAELDKQDAVTKYFKHPLVLEATKIGYDWVKNLTTLSTASILILVALIDRVFSAPVGIWLVYLALFSFMLTILGSIYAMFAIVE
jgi:hypothetical protein